VEALLAASQKQKQTAARAALPRQVGLFRFGTTGEPTKVKYDQTAQVNSNQTMSKQGRKENGFSN
jgi:hypothetical protein